jgi:hypothetical protein
MPVRDACVRSDPRIEIVTTDELTGAITFADNADANTYGVIDEIAGRALANGARVLGVRQADLPEGSDLAAILRYPI